ncbi:hypothetical protein [Nonomuraea soli]|uniref:Uncharacterized protein (TIGR04222 family) n=1 Tax=Nonomuraea soli TaxID=1032476 RepID=A0A7W0HU62_9ACTN|nr:hypothetical protein [Nonomuraea soli]MBA2895657.1 uncharacterized protein (TIGR04222 family) [Nonomuraea soli]
MADTGRFDRDGLAHLRGGARRVALAALAELLTDGRLRTDHADRLYRVDGAQAADPVEAAALERRGDVRGALRELSRHESVRAVGERVRRSGLNRRGLLGTKPTAEGARLIEEARGHRRRVAIRVALDGVEGIPEGPIRKLFVRAGAGPIRGTGDGGWTGTGGEDGGGSGGND